MSSLPLISLTFFSSSSLVSLFFLSYSPFTIFLVTSDFPSQQVQPCVPRVVTSPPVLDTVVTTTNAVEYAYEAPVNIDLDALQVGYSYMTSFSVFTFHLSTKSFSPFPRLFCWPMTTRWVCYLFTSMYPSPSLDHIISSPRSFTWFIIPVLLVSMYVYIYPCLLCYRKLV